MVTRTKKIFVGGVSASTTEEDLSNYFNKFGSVSTTSFLNVFAHDLGVIIKIFVAVLVHNLSIKIPEYSLLA